MAFVFDTSGACGGKRSTSPSMSLLKTRGIALNQSLMKQIAGHEYAVLGYDKHAKAIALKLCLATEAGARKISIHRNGSGSLTAVSFRNRFGLNPSRYVALDTSYDAERKMVIGYLPADGEC